MFPITILLKKLAFFLSKFLQILKNQKRRVHENNISYPSQSGFQYFQFRSGKPDLENHVLIFHAETVLLRSPSLFPYFMLVAFEAGGLIRALILFLLCPLISILPHGLSLRIMVMVSFLGLKKEKFNAGKAVLPKFFLEDIGKESFEMLRGGKITMAISDLPRVMVESFLGDYLDVDYVFAREMKCFGAYFLGVMEERRDRGSAIGHILKKSTSNAIGIIGRSSKFGDCEWFSNCKEMYLVSEQERRQWTPLSRDSYPKPLVFHDGRLAFRPTFLATLAMFMWLPLGFVLSILRIAIALTLPSTIALFLIHLSGAKLEVSYPNTSFVPQLQEKRKLNKSKGVLFVCNHRTLLDPLLIFYSLKTPLTAVVYSLSKTSEILSPIKTIRLTRNRDKDANLMHELLSRGDLVVCPEGTTCREPYLLRFSSLFTEICDEICPVAIDCHVNMFYGTTASGLKSLDPLFFFMNPLLRLSVRFLDMVQCGLDESWGGNGCLKYERANLVQDLIAKELGFTCTRLTRKDKYLILAGNEGIVKDG